MKSRKTLIVIIFAFIIPSVLNSQPAWQVQTSPVGEDLVSVSFADTVNGWAVSGTGTVIHTTDGGQNWQTQKSMAGFIPEKIFFQTDQTGWMAGSSLHGIDTAFILKTEDGGSNWTASYVHLSAKIYDIFFINDTMGWAVGFSGDTLGMRLHTVDAGQTWDVQTGINVKGIFTSVHFRNTDRGDICGPGPVMMHTNSGGRGGSGWALELTNLKKPMYDLVNVGDIYGCMVGADGKLFFTKDQWNNFMEYDYEDGDTLWSVDAIEPLGFWVVGEAGTILFVGYNQFLGLTVEDQSLDIPQSLADLSAVDDAHAWTVGEEGTILFFGFGQASGIHSQKTSGISVFPNPAAGYVQISNINNLVEHIEIYSLQGKLIKTFPLSHGQPTATINLNGMDSGMYILKAGDEQQLLIVIQQ
jgi:photosystem II stability/assembly factor-like uncharacterized protein